MSNAIQKQQGQKGLSKGALDTMVKEFAQRKGDFEKMLPPKWSADRFLERCRLAMVKTPKLLECDPGSVILSAFQAAEMGLIPNSSLGHGWIIPYGKQAQWVTGYQGLIFLAERAGVVRKVEPPRVVYERCVKEGRFIHREGDNRRLDYDPTPKDLKADKGEVVAAFFTYLLADGQRSFHVMDREELLERRERSSGYQNAIQWKKSHPWLTDFVPMCKKTVIRDGLKYASKDGEDDWGDRLSKAFHAEDADVFDVDGGVVEEEATHEPTSRVAGLKAALKAKTREEAPLEDAAVTPAWRDDAAMSEMAQKTGSLPLSHPDAQPPEPGAEG